MPDDAQRTFKAPADARWEPNGQFQHSETIDITFDCIVEAARLLVAVSRLNGVSVQGLILQALTFQGSAPVAGEAAPGGGPAAGRV